MKLPKKSQKQRLQQLNQKLSKNPTDIGCINEVCKVLYELKKYAELAKFCSIKIKQLELSEVKNKVSEEVILYYWILSLNHTHEYNAAINLYNHNCKKLTSLPKDKTKILHKIFHKMVYAKNDYVNLLKYIDKELANDSTNIKLIEEKCEILLKLKEYSKLVEFCHQKISELDVVDITDDSDDCKENTQADLANHNIIYYLILALKNDNQPALALQIFFELLLDRKLALLDNDLKVNLFQNLGEISQLEKNYAIAITQYSDALSILENLVAEAGIIDKEGVIVFDDESTISGGIISQIKFNLGVCHFELKQYDQALACFNQIKDVNSTNMFFHKAESIIKQNIASDLVSINILESVINPIDSETFSKVAKNCKEALENLLLSMGDNKNSAALYHNKGLTEFYSENFTAASQSFGEAANIFAENSKQNASLVINYHIALYNASVSLYIIAQLKIEETELAERQHFEDEDDFTPISRNEYQQLLEQIRLNFNSFQKLNFAPNKIQLYFTYLMCRIALVEGNNREVNEKNSEFYALIAKIDDIEKIEVSFDCANIYYLLGKAEHKRGNFVKVTNAEIYFEKARNIFQETLALYLNAKAKNSAQYSAILEQKLYLSIGLTALEMNENFKALEYFGKVIFHTDKFDNMLNLAYKEASKIFARFQAHSLAKMCLIKSLEYTNKLLEEYKVKENVISKLSVHYKFLIKNSNDELWLDNNYVQYQKAADQPLESTYDAFVYGATLLNYQDAVKQYNLQNYQQVFKIINKLYLTDQVLENLGNIWSHVLIGLAYYQSQDKKALTYFLNIKVHLQEQLKNNELEYSIKSYLERLTDFVEYMQQITKEENDPTFINNYGWTLVEVDEEDDDDELALEARKKDERKLKINNKIASYLNGTSQDILDIETTLLVAYLNFLVHRLNTQQNNVFDHQNDLIDNIIHKISNQDGSITKITSPIRELLANNQYDVKNLFKILHILKLSSATDSQVKALEITEKYALNQVKKPAMDCLAQDNAYNNRKNSKYLYQAQDIKYITSEVMQEYIANFNLAEPIGDAAALGNNLQKLIKQAKETNLPTLVTYNLGNYHWVSFVILADEENNLYMLYKDSKGQGNQFLERQAEERNLIFKYNSFAEQTTGLDCGIFAIENLVICAKQIKKDPSFFIENFEDFDDFCSLEQARQLRKEKFADKYLTGIKKSVVEEYNKAQILKQIRQYHKDDLVEIAKLFTDNIDKLKNIYHDFTVKIVDDNESYAMIGQNNTIALEIRTSDNFNLANNSYNVKCAISCSNDIDLADITRILGVYGKNYLTEDQLIKVEVVGSDSLNLNNLNIHSPTKDELSATIFNSINPKTTEDYLAIMGDL